MLHSTLLLLMVAALGLAGAPDPGASAAAGELIAVYRSKTCGCCGKWVEHLKQAGFETKDYVVDAVDNAPGRDRVPSDLRSCHIARVRQYVIEGHVPADVIQNLLKKRPEFVGLAVPGMPAGSPGMESPNPVPYDVIAWDRTGRRSTFAKK